MKTRGDAARALADAGWSVKEIALALHMTDSNVRYHLREERPEDEPVEAR